MLTLSEYLRLVAFQLILEGWPAEKLSGLYELASRLDANLA